jgi:hypothetical protein
VCSSVLPPVGRNENRRREGRELGFASLVVDIDALTLQTDMVLASSVVSVDPASTRRRRRKLQRYVETTLLLDGSFLCPSYAACKSSTKPGHVFREGTMSHLGKRYDAFVDGRPLRIVDVGQESADRRDRGTGWPKGPGNEHLQRRVPMDVRSDQVLGSGLERRYYKQDGRAARNPHMRGTTSALRVLFGKELGIAHDEEFVHPVKGRAFHLFDGFALVNALLCSAGPQDSSQGHPTSTMFRSCATHLGATLDILQPTVVVLQGHKVSRWAVQVLPVHTPITEHLYASEPAFGRALVCRFSHPSAHGDQRWGDKLTSTYLTRIVRPTLERATQLLPPSV